MRKLLLLLAALSMTLGAFVAHAQQTLPSIFSQPSVVPTPRDPDPHSYSLSVVWNGCGGWDPKAVSVMRSGSIVNVTLGGVDSLGFPCVPGGGVLFPLGSFPPGTYTVVFQAVYFAPGVGTYPPLTTEFTVGSTPTATPASSSFSLAVLGILLLVFATRTMSRRYSTRQ